MAAAMLRSWDLNLQINRDNQSALYLQIADKIIEEIRLGRLSPSSVMPGTRELADRLRVNRKTIVLTYDELIAQGWLVTENRRGTFVSPNPPAAAYGQSHERLINSDIRPGHMEPRRTEPSFEFNDGLPDTRLMPFDALSRAFRHALHAVSRHKQPEDDAGKGLYELRSAIATMLNMEMGLRTHPDNLCMARSCQMAVYLIGRTLLAPGAVVALARLSSPAIRETLKACGANLVDVDLDEMGMDIDALERLCSTTKVSMVHISPQHQYPTTVSLPQERRKKLLKLAALHDFLILESDQESEFNFSQQPMFPLASEDTDGRVVYIGNLSKILAPELRVSYVAASPDIVNRLAREVTLFDQQNNCAIEMTIAELMKTGEIKRHGLKMTKIYQDRRDHMRQLLDDELWQWVDYQSPQSGLAFWLKFRDAVDIKKMEQKSREEKVRFAFGKTYSMTGETVPAVRLGFAHMNEKEMQQGFQRLKHIVASCLIATIISCCSASELIEMSPMSSGLVKMSHTLED